MTAKPLRRIATADAPPGDRINKAQARRDQILTAAVECARKAGFHAASMAQIAKASGLSVGQIYRYFENKEEIIAALVAREAASTREAFSRIDQTPGPLLDSIAARLPAEIDRCLDEAHTALRLEFLAEAARNPAVAETVRQTDARETALSAQLMSRLRRPEWNDDNFMSRVEMIGLVFDGLQTLAVRRPHADRVMLTRHIQTMINLLFGPA
jgi:AcrR family transcriptional regulator